MKIIALTGEAGSGKDTAAYIIQLLTGSTVPEHMPDGVMSVQKDLMVNLPAYVASAEAYGMRVMNRYCAHRQIAKFAYPVYQVAAILLGVHDPVELMSSAFKDNPLPKPWKGKGKHKPETGRQFLQLIGEECVRQTLCLEGWINVMETNLDKRQQFLVTDLRYPNEDEYLKRKGAYIIKLIRPGKSKQSWQTHSSETLIDQIVADRIIHNTGDYFRLAAELEAVCLDLNILNCKYTWKLSNQ